MLSEITGKELLNTTFQQHPKLTTLASASFSRRGSRAVVRTYVPTRQTDTNMNSSFQKLFFLPAPYNQIPFISETSSELNDSVAPLLTLSILSQKAHQFFCRLLCLSYLLKKKVPYIPAVPLKVAWLRYGFLWGMR